MGLGGKNLPSIKALQEYSELNSTELPLHGMGMAPPGSGVHGVLRVNKYLFYNYTKHLM